MVKTLILLSILFASSHSITIDLNSDGSHTLLDIPTSDPTEQHQETNQESHIIHTTVDPNPTVDFSTDLPLFVPTDIWQEVLPGQHVPGGLHYRLDLEQGKKWAKKLPGDTTDYSEDEDDDLKRVLIIDNNDDKGSDSDTTNIPGESTSAKKRRKHKKKNKGLKTKKLTKEETALQRAELMDRVLRGLPAPPPELIGLNRKIDPEKWKQVLNTLWIKRQKEIHSASSAIHNSATAMMNATRDLLDNTTTVPEKLQILTAMEREVRQIDNAQDYKTVGGLAVTASLLEDPSLDVVRMAAFVTATASRNHLVVQAAALELGVVDTLMKYLKIILTAQHISSGDATGTELYSRIRTETKLLLALGAVVRGSKDSVRHFKHIGGNDVLIHHLITTIVNVLNDSALESIGSGVNVINGNGESMNFEVEGTTLTLNPNAEVQVDGKQIQRGLCGLRDKAYTIVTDLIDSDGWIVKANETIVLMKSCLNSHLKCDANPSREVVLHLLKSVRKNDGKGDGKNDTKSDGTSDGNGEGEGKGEVLSGVVLKEVNEMVDVWRSEWKKELIEDPEDEYASDLLRLSEE